MSSPFTGWSKKKTYKKKGRATRSKYGNLKMASRSRFVSIKDHKYKMHSVSCGQSIYYFGNSSSGGGNSISGAVQLNNTTGAEARAYFFALANIPNIAELQALYDRCKLHMIEMIWEPNYNSLDPFGQPLYGASYARWVYDNDDSTMTSADTEQAFFEYNSMKSFDLKKRYKIKLVPYALTQAQDTSGTLTSGVSKNYKNQWLDLASTNLKFRGVKIFYPYFTNGTSTTTVNMGQWRFNYILTCSQAK